MKLTIELVPQSCFFSNVRSTVSRRDWDTLRYECYDLAGHRCEICGSRGKKYAVECHEIWEYDDKNHVQKLVRLIALCPMCHRCKHWGLSRIKGLEEDCYNHFCIVNQVSYNEASHIVFDAFEVWENRSFSAWKADLTFLDKKNIKYNKER